MTSSVFFAVLAAAVLHAVWNALVKDSRDRLLAMGALGMGASLFALCALPFVGMPDADVWPFIAASVLVHTAYKVTLARAYTAGDFGQVYPLARGAAPLLSTLIAIVAAREFIPPTVAGGAIVLCLGVAAMSLKGDAVRLNRTAVAYALATSAFIASYTVIDALGARRTDDLFAFIAWLFFLDGVSIAAVYLWRRRDLRALAGAAPFGLLAGGISSFAYILVIWAMTKAPIGAVAALRETSVLFAVAIATLFMGEKLGAWRILAALMITLGASLIRVGSSA